MAKVLMVGDVNFPPIDPRIYKEAKSLIHAGHEITLVHMGQKGQKRNDTFESIKLHRLYVPEKYTGISAIDYMLEYSLFSLAVFFKLPLIYKQTKFDIIHVHNPPDFLVWSVAPFSKLMKKKIVFDVHDPFPELLLNRPDVPAKNLLSTIAKISQKIALYLSDEVITVNKTIAKNLEK